MGLTPHHARYYAHDLTRRSASGLDHLSMSLFDAAVDLNPHQIEAALFALQNSLVEIYGLSTLIDLKVGKLTHQDIGQMESYVRVFDAHAQPPCDNPTIGLILCS